MNIIKEITELKQQYDNNHNTYEIVLRKDFDAEEFTNILKKCRNHKWDDIEITDSKQFINQGTILDVDINGNMRCYSKKMLKFRYIDNVKLNLYNKRKMNIDGFHCGLRTERFVQNMVIFKKNNIGVILMTKTLSERVGKKTETIITRELIIRMKHVIDENKLSNILSIFDK